MPDDDTPEARKQRADRLRRQIRRLLEKEGDQGAGVPAEPKNPRDRIHDKMKELDREPEGDGSE